MKKRLLFLMWLAIMSSTYFLVNAQSWTAPALTFSDLTSGTTYYVYNVGSNGFLNRGGEWSMHAVVTALPKANASIIKWTAVNTSGSIWTFQYNSNGSNVANNYLFAVGGGSVYTDNSTDNTWDVVLTDATAKIYSIQVVSTYSGYNATQYLGSASTTESTNRGIANTVRYNRAGGDNYTQWKFVSQADMDLYNAKVLLDRYMNYAKIRGGIDISSYITTYNAGVTADINTAAGNLLAALGVTPVTVPNYSFEADLVQTGWTKNGSWDNQTNNNQYFTKDGTNYTEKWTNTGTNLGTRSITQTISGLANGVYGLVASGHAVQGSNPFHTGAFFTAGASSTEVSAGGDYSVDHVIVSNATSGSNGTLTIGFALSGTVTCNWTGFDNFRLYYYGAIVNPTLIISKSSLTFPVPGTKKVAVTGLNLTNDITITAPTHFSVSPSTLLSTVAGDSVAITYDGGASASGYVVFASGTTKDSVQVSGTAIPTIVPSIAGLLLDDIIVKDSLTITGTNLTSDITITAPAGITVNPTSISKTNATAIKVYVTYDKITTVNDSIVFTSGTLVKKIGIKAVSNAGCFTPLYASGNLVSNPTFSSLSGYDGWGSMSISTRPDSVYCGNKSGKITGRCGGSMNAPFSPALKSNSVYRLKAAVLTMGGSFKIGMNNIGTGLPNYVASFNTNGKWKVVDTTVVTGDNTTCDLMWFNSCEDETGTTGYIDNWEFYNITPYATLSDLTVNGTSVAGFDSTVYTYNVVSPTVPTVAATAAVAGAVVNITQATAVPGTATVTVTSADGYVTNTYSINITAFSTDASLSALSVSADTLKPVFAPATLKYYVQIPKGTAIPTVTATANNAGATVVITPATSVPDTTIVKVTAEDGTTTKNYEVNMWDIKLAGTVIGHSGSWNNNPATLITAAFDGNTSTFVDALTDTAGYVGWDLGAGKKAKLTSMRYFPRTTHASRMVGGEIRGANNADLSDSVILYTITATPSTTTYTDVILNVAGSYRYIYYRSPAGGYCNIAELELYGDTAVTSGDATLSDLQVNGALVTGFAPGTTTYNVVLPVGTSAIPVVSATANQSQATIAITQATSVTGSATVVVTALDGTTQLTYTLSFTVAKSTVATLSDLKVNSTTVTGFAAGTLTYAVVLPAGTTTIPTVSATTTDPNAAAAITEATALPGSASVLVTAEDGVTTKTYTISFTVAKSTVATLSDLKVNSNTVTGFAPGTTSYAVVLPAGTTTIPTVTATTTDPNATAEVTQATALPGLASVLVTAEDGTATKAYVINFTIANGIIGINSGVKVYPTITSGNFTVETNGKADITVIDTKGRIVSRKVTASSLQTVSVKDAGMYIIKVTSGGTNSIFKVVKTQ